jgi:histidinol-phosphate aminotransferase
MTLWPQWLPLRKDLRGKTPYGAPQLEIPVRLNTNENPFPLTDEIQGLLAAKVKGTLKNLNRYPDRDAIELREGLAQYIQNVIGVHVQSENIWAANGSNEILQSIFLAFEGAALGFEPSYSMHPIISEIVSKEWISVARDEKYEIDIDQARAAIEKEKPGLVFVTTPNNPTGNSTPISIIEQLAISVAQVGGLLVVDEAYGEFSDDDSAITLQADYPHIAVVKTMSKAFAFAGTRIGYLVADPAIVHSILLVRLPYHLSSLTQSLGLAALELAPVISHQVLQLKQERTRVIAELKEMGITTVDSSANFLLFSGFRAPSAQIWRGLIDRGVLVRDVGISGALRVTIGRPHENDAFLQALRESL